MNADLKCHVSSKTRGNLAMHQLLELRRKARLEREAHQEPTEPTAGPRGMDDLQAGEV
jgi:hypothetical protein